MKQLNKNNNLLKIKKLFINFSFRSAANLFSKVVALITLPIVTRALGPASYGDFNLVILIMTYTSLPIGLLGLRSYGIREIAAKRKKDVYALDILSMQLTVATLSIFISILITFFIFKDNHYLYLAIILGYLSVFVNSLNLEFFYVAKKNLIFPTVTRLIGQFFYVIGIILFIKRPNDVPVLVILASLTPVISNLIQLRKFSQNYYTIKLHFNLKQALTTFKLTYKLGISRNLENLFSSIPQILISFILGSYALGIFMGGYKIYSILVMFYITLFYALAPYLVNLNSYHYKKRRKYHLFMVIIILFISITFGIILYLWGGSILLLILGEKFVESIFIFKIISLTLIPLTPINMLLLNILIFSNKDKYYLYSTLVSTVIVLFSSTFLVKNFGAVGGVYAMTIGLIGSIVIALYFYIKTIYTN